jgi:polyribonucleotide nucleotidyltransferase
VNDPQIHIGERNPFPPAIVFVKVQDKFVGLIIGKQGETLKNIASQTNTKIFMPQKNPTEAQAQNGEGLRTVELTGNDKDC